MIEPPLGAPYRPARGPLKIGKEEVAEICAVPLKPAVYVSLKAVDVKTGAGIEGVRFEYETETTRQRRHLHSQLVFVDHPATGEHGQLQAIVEPERCSAAPRRCDRICDAERRRWRSHAERGNAVNPPSQV